MNSAGQLGGAFCLVLFGYLADKFHNYNLPVFFIAAMVFTRRAL